MSVKFLEMYRVARTEKPLRVIPSTPTPGNPVVHIYAKA